MAKRFKEEEIVKILKEAEEVGNVREIIRKHNVSEQSFYRWRQKYGGMETSEVRRLKDLERENAELKKIVADLTLDNRLLRDVNAKKMVSLAERRSMTDYLVSDYGISERRACRVIELARSTHRSRPYQAKHIELTAEISCLSYAYSRFGYRKIHTLLVNAGWAVSRETVRLTRKREGLQVQKKQPKKRLLGKSTTQLQKAQYPNHVWSYDFVFDQTPMAACSNT